MTKRQRNIDGAISTLATLYDCGELRMATDPADLLREIAAEIRAARAALLTWKPTPDPLPEGVCWGQYWRLERGRKAFVCLAGYPATELHRLRLAGPQKGVLWSGPILPPPLPEEAPDAR